MAEGSVAAWRGAPPPEEPGRLLAYKWRVLISVIFGIFMIILDATVINVALQTLRREYDATLTGVQWIISIYVLALGITTPLSGFLADRFGIKRICVGGLALFVLGSFLCGLAPALGFLIVTRALQGIGGGLAQPLAAAFLVRTFPPEEQGKALGFFGIGLVVAPALGPILGGYLVDQDLWRWIFFINIPIGLLGIALAARWLREYSAHRRPRWDPLGLITVVIGTGAVLYGSTTAERDGWSSGQVLFCFALGAVALLAFGWIELRLAPEPLLDLRLYRNRTFAIASLIGYVTVVALFGAEFLMPIYLQALRGRSALETGVLLLPLAIVSGITIPIAGRLFDKIGPRPLVVLGFAILVINTWQLAKLEATTAIGYILFLLALRGLALGLTVQTTFAAALGVISGPAVARGSSLVNSTRFMVQSIGVAILATVLASTLSPQVKTLQEAFQQGKPVSQIFAGQTSGTTAPTGAPAPAQAPAPAKQFGICEAPGTKFGPPANLPPPAVAGITVACQQNVDGFERAYRLTFYVAIAAVVIGLFLPGWPARWAGRGAETRGAPQPTTAAAR